jgi:hypothetical protein
MGKLLYSGMTNFKISNVRKVTSQGKMSVQQVPRAGFDRMPTGTNKPRNLHHQYRHFYVKTLVKTEVKFREFLTSALDRGGGDFIFNVHEETRQYLRLDGHIYIYIHYFMFINCRGLSYIRPIICHLKNSSHKWKTQFTRII